MCGISVCLGAEKITAHAFVKRANQLMAHRGPDAEGIFQNEMVALGHRRLAIIDLSKAGDQPMISPDGELAIVFNGEIYNHQELRKKYCKNWSFKSSSDTETLLALFSVIGTNLFDKLVGMWAIAVWNNSEQKLIISRDRYGQKPLYWKRFDDGSLRFASEIKPLLGNKNKLYATAVGEFLALGNYGHLGERTFFQDIHHFPPGNFCVISAREKNISPIAYWKFPKVALSEKHFFDNNLCNTLRDAIEEAVRSQLLADVKVGATLSGGLDSTIIVGLMAKHYEGKEIPVFTAQTKGSKYDESKYVRDVEAKWGNDRINLFWKELIATQLSETLYPTISIQEEPFGDPSIIAHGFLMDAAKEANVPVILGGQGADELFFGYGFMTSSILSSNIRRLQLSDSWENMNLMNIPTSSRLRILFSAFLPSMELAVRKRSRRNRRSWLSQNLLTQIEDHTIKLSNAGDFHEVWMESIERVNLPHLMHYDDRNGMARSIEGRMPFLDHRIADILSTINPISFLKDGKNKYLLRETCVDIIPTSIMERRDKIGFYTPLYEMIRKDKKWIYGLLNDDLSKDLNLFDINVLKNDFQYLEQNSITDNNLYLRIWRSLAVRVWAELFNVTSA